MGNILKSLQRADTYVEIFHSLLHLEAHFSFFSLGIKPGSKSQKKHITKL